MILLYPRTADVDESILEEYELKKINCRIKVSTVDLRFDLTESKNKMKLINEISNILAQKEV